MAGFTDNTHSAPVPVQVYDDDVNLYAAGVTLGLDGTAPVAQAMTSAGFARMQVENAGTITEYTENVAFVGGKAGRLGIGIRVDTLTERTDADGKPLALAADKYGAQHVRQIAQSAATTQVADSATSVQLVAANGDRKGLTIVNDSSADLYVKLGTTASATDYTVKLVQDAYWEMPFHYTGRVDGIWASDPGDGAARITEVT